MEIFNNDPLNSYNLGNAAEYESAHNNGIDENGDLKRLNLFIDIAKEKGLNDEQISSVVSSFNAQLRANKLKHAEHVVDSGMHLVAGGIMTAEIYVTLEAGKMVYQLRNVKVGNVTEGPVNTIQVPGRVQSRVNLRNGSASEGAGWEHVVDRHFNSTKNASQFTVTQQELRGILQSETVVNTPISRALESADGIRYVREINLNRTIGVDKFSGQPTSIMTVLTDKFGNLVTATPGVIR